MAYLYLALAFCLNAAANILLKLGAEHRLALSGGMLTLIRSNSVLLIGLVFFAANVPFYYLALRTLPLSVAYPVMVAMSFLIISFYALFALGETVSVFQIAGYICIVAGLILALGRFA